MNKFSKKKKKKHTINHKNKKKKRHLYKTTVCLIIYIRIRDKENKCTSAKKNVLSGPIKYTIAITIDV
jgi:hypothetical protein